MIFFIAITIAVIVAILAIRQHLYLKAKAKECAIEAQEFHNKVQELTTPPHFFTDEELKQVKSEYAPLFNKISKLYERVLISTEYLDNLGLKDILHERKFLNHLQYQNNKKFQQQNGASDDKSIQ